MKDPEQTPVERNQPGKKKLYRAARRKSHKRSQRKGKGGKY